MLKDSTFLDAMVKSRKLQSYCSHDLRSMIGVVKTTLSLYEEEPAHENPQIHRLLKQAHKSIDKALKGLDGTVEDLRLQSRFIWILSDSSPTSEYINPENSLDVVIGFQSLPRFFSELNSYRPDLVLFDSSLLENEKIEDFLTKLSPRRTNAIFFEDHEASGLIESLESGGIQEIKKWPGSWTKAISQESRS